MIPDDPTPPPPHTSAGADERPPDVAEAGAAVGDPLPAPVAERRPHQLNRAGATIDDPYAWLADREDPATIAYLTAENAHTAAWFAPHRRLTDQIFSEIRSRTQETDIGDPVPVDDWFYVVTTQADDAYPTFRRGRTADTADTELVLDLNVEADGYDYFDLGGFTMSPDHRLAAWAADTNGDEHYTVRLRDVATGTDHATAIEHTAAAGLAWSADGLFLFYVTADEAERPYQVWRHHIGTDPTQDEIVYTEADEAFFVGIGGTRNDAAIVIHTASRTTSESWLIDATAPTSPARCVRPRVDGVEYQVDHWGNALVVLTNLDAIDFRVMLSAGPGSEWTELVAHQAGRRIAGVDAFADFLALYEWSAAQEQIRIVFRDGRQRVLALDSAPHEVGFGSNERYDTTVIRLSHQSLTLPPRIVDIDVNTDQVTVIKQRPTPNVSIADYRSERLWAVAEDGTEVPVDIVTHRDTPLDGSAPCMIYAYGAYELSVAPWFSVARLSLLDRGHVWALAHPRGGGELGRQWYLDGRLDRKTNTFTDIFAIVDHLVDRKIANPDRLALRGGSAGGLAVGACITMRPERFAAAIAEVPFVDVVTTMSDPSLPLTVTEWDEWGDPRSEPFATYIASYSPYDNTVAAAYPACYLTAGLNDPRVGFHEPAKWAARLRHETTSGRPILLKTELGAGHGGPTGRYDAWRDEAATLTFCLVTLDSPTRRHQE